MYIITFINKMSWIQSISIFLNQVIFIFREHLLHRMLVPMSVSRATLDMFEENSFLRNRGLLTFLRQILLPLDDLEVVLENSVTHGISSPCV